MRTFEIIRHFNGEHFEPIIMCVKHTNLVIAWLLSATTVRKETSAINLNEYIEIITVHKKLIEYPQYKSHNVVRETKAKLK